MTNSHHFLWALGGGGGAIPQPPTPVTTSLSKDNQNVVWISWWATCRITAFNNRKDFVWGDSFLDIFYSGIWIWAQICPNTNQFCSWVKNIFHFPLKCQAHYCIKPWTLTIIRQYLFCYYLKLPITTLKLFGYFIHTLYLC